MAEYLCKRFDFESIVKCSFSLSDSELKVLLELVKCNDSQCVVSISKKLGRERSTIQKIMHNLFDKGLIKKKKEILEEGGYVFYYFPKSKSELKKQMLESVETWHSNVKKEIMKW